MDLPHLKQGKTGNAKYRRRVTSPQMQAMIGTKAVEWSLKTRDPLKILDAWKVAHAKFEALQAKAEGVTTDQVQWDILIKAAVDHGLARPEESKIGPVDFQLEGGRFDAFTASILAEADKLTPQRLNVPFVNKPPLTPVEMLTKAKLFGVERPPILLSAAVQNYLKNRERRSSYVDLEKQVNLSVSILEDAMNTKDPIITSIDDVAAYAFRDKLIAKGNSQGTLKRRITTIKAVLNSGKKRLGIKGWDNPFNGIEMPDDDGAAGEVKRDPLTLDEIRKARDKQTQMNDDARDIWHLMMFTGLGPNEARGLQWNEVDLDHPTPHFEVRANGRRRLKTGERQRRVPLVGTALAMVHRRLGSASEDALDVFPRYANQRNANTLSATLIKPMKSAKVWVKIRKVPYSLRHSVKAWLERTVSTDFQSLLLGHGAGGGRVASGYSSDDLLDIQATHLEKALRVGGVVEYPKLPEKLGS